MNERLVVNEHFVPQDGVTLDEYMVRGHRTAVTHLIRYEWAEEVLADSGALTSLLDVACGSGYGTHRLAMRFPDLHVTGADYDATALEHARSRHTAPNLEFVQADVTRWRETLGDRMFDCVISFDTIEHVEHREIMMENLVDHLRPDGMLLLSTPVKTNNVLNPGWEHHKIEFSRKSLHDFLRRYFGEVLNPEAGTLPHRDVFQRVNSEEILYLLKMNPVVCLKPVRVAPPVRDAFPV